MANKNIKKEDDGISSSGIEVGDIYFLKTRKIRYLMSKEYKSGHCQVCGEKKKTTAHHLIPRRLKCICKLLSEVRMRVCSECHDNFHPENELIRESDIVKRKSKKISSLQNVMKDKNNEIRVLTKKLKSIRKDKDDACIPLSMKGGK